jgi:hypothetical protein
VDQHLQPDLVGHRGQQRVALVGLQRAEAMAAPVRILMLTSWSDESTPAELSMASVLIRPPRAQKRDAAGLRQAQVRALADDPWPLTSPPSMRMASLALSPTSASLSAAPSHRCRCRQIEQSRLAFRMARHQAAGSEHRPVMSSAALISGVRSIDLASARRPAALGDLALVVVLPGRARQVEHPVALGQLDGRIRRRVDEDVAVVEGGDSDLLRTAA